MTFRMTLLLLPFAFAAACGSPASEEAATTEADNTTELPVDPVATEAVAVEAAPAPEGLPLEAELVDAQSGELASATKTPSEIAEMPAYKPDSAESIRSLLQARHVQDLPTRATLDQHADAEGALRWLAVNDDQAIVRSRALGRLGFYPDSELFLIEQLANPTQPESVRAGAIVGLGHLGLETHDSARAAVLEQVSSKSLRLGLEATGALQQVSAAADDLARLKDNPLLLEEVRARLNAM